MSENGVKYGSMMRESEREREGERERTTEREREVESVCVYCGASVSVSTPETM
jgi:hypothetical protein